MRRNLGPAAGLIIAALFVARYLVVHDRSLGLSHGGARVIVVIVFALGLLCVRLLARRHH